MRIDGHDYTVVTRAGVFAHDVEDPAAILLARHVAITAGDVVVHLHCRNGLFGAAAAAAGAARVLLTDRSIVAVEAARRTLAANGVQGVDVLPGQGSHPLPPGLAADVVAIRIPREKVALLQLLRDAFDLLRIGGRLYLAGATNEGIRSAATTAGRIFGNSETVAHGSGHRVVVAVKLAAAPADPQPLESPWLDHDAFRETRVNLRGVELTVCARPGVFSWDGVDEATSLLAEALADAMDVRACHSLLDLGCGTGVLGVLAARLAPDCDVCMVDDDVEAVRSAARTATVAGVLNATALASDVVAAVADRRFDVIATNPPFHVGRATNLDLPLRFIHGARQVLAPGGRLFLVANRTLPYEAAIRAVFGSTGTVREGRRFKVLSASSPD
ncbi:MAG: methyltransferase [Gemmatimonadota bacterium]